MRHQIQAQCSIRHHKIQRLCMSLALVATTVLALCAIPLSNTSAGAASSPYSVTISGRSCTVLSGSVYDNGVIVGGDENQVNIVGIGTANLVEVTDPTNGSFIGFDMSASTTVPGGSYQWQFLLPGNTVIASGTVVVPSAPSRLRSSARNGCRGNLQPRLLV